METGWVVLAGIIGGPSLVVGALALGAHIGDAIHGRFEAKFAPVTAVLLANGALCIRVIWGAY